MTALIIAWIGLLAGGQSHGQFDDAEARFRSYLEGTVDLETLVAPVADGLKSPAPRIRRRAADTLLGWLMSTRAGVRSGEIQPIRTPYLNMPWIDRGRDLLTKTLGYLGDSLPPEAVILSEWYLEQKEDSARWIGFRFLSRTRGSRADALLEGIIAHPRQDYRMVEAAVREATSRRLPVPRSVLLEHASSYRASLAEAVRALNDSLGYAPLAPFDSLQALESRGLVELMNRLDSLAVGELPESAPYVELRYAEGRPHSTLRRFRLTGWMLREDERGFSLYDPAGLIVDDVWSDSTWDALGGLVYIRTVLETPRSYDAEALRLRDPSFWDLWSYLRPDTTVDGPLLISLGDFHNDEFGTPELFEINLARWLYHHGPRSTAARVLLPMIERYPSDESLLDTAREKYGNLVGYRMLQAFVGDRDYPETMRLARIVLERYPDIHLAEEAAGLLNELPRRMNDFKEFFLPTPDEWRDLQTRLSRREQIGYLLDRLRLVTVSRQFREPPGLSQDAAYLLDRGSTRVIDPVDELLSSPEAYGTDLHLGLGDLLQIIPYLAEDWYMPCVDRPSRWEPSGTGGQRWLIRTSYDLDLIIEIVAGERIFDYYKYRGLNDRDRRAYLDELIAWTERNKDKSPGQLCRERIADSPRLFEKLRHLNRLFRLEGEGAEGDLLALADPDTLSAYDVLSILGLTDALRSAAQGSESPTPAGLMAPFARRVLHRPEQAVRLEAGRILLEAGDSLGARTLRAELDTSAVTPETLKYLGALLRRGDPRDLALADRVLPGAKEGLARNGSALVQLVLLGRPEGYEWLLEALSDTSATGVTVGSPYGMTRGRVDLETANNLLSYGPLPDSLRRVSNVYDLSDESQARVVEELEAWTRERLEAVDRGRRR